MKIRIILTAIVLLGIVSESLAQMPIFIGSKERRTYCEGTMNWSLTVLFGRDRAVDRVPQTVSQFIAPQDVGASLESNMNFEFNHPDLRPINEKTGEPNYEVRLRINAEYLSVRWDRRDGYVLDPINPDKYPEGIRFFSIEVRFPKVKAYREWFILGIRIAGTAHNEFMNEVTSLPIHFRPYDGKPFGENGDYTNFSDWMSREMGYSASGDNNTVIGGVARNYRRPGASADPVQPNPPAATTQGTYQVDLDKVQKDIEGKLAEPKIETPKVETPKEVATFTLSSYENQDMYALKANVIGIVQVNFGTGFKKPDPVKVKMGETVYVPKSAPAAFTITFEYVDEVTGKTVTKVYVRENAKEVAKI